MRPKELGVRASVGLRMPHAVWDALIAEARQSGRELSELIESVLELRHLAARPSARCAGSGRGWFAQVLGASRSRSARPVCPVCSVSAAALGVAGAGLASQQRWGGTEVPVWPGQVPDHVRREPLPEGM